jgi:hypothetical protein
MDALVLKQVSTIPINSTGSSLQKNHILYELLCNFMDIKNPLYSMTQNMVAHI